MSRTESATSSKIPEAVLPAARVIASGTRFWLVLWTLLAIETGVFLIVVPWSSGWDENLVVNYYSSLRPILLSHYMRGALSGLGLVNLWLGVAEVVDWLGIGRRPAEQKIQTSKP